MAKEKETGKLYEITKERPATSFEMVLSIGSIGAAVGFFMTLVLGACTGFATMDGLLLVSLVMSVLGFGLGLIFGWFILKYLGGLLEAITHPKANGSQATQISSTQDKVDLVSEPAVVDDEDKGKSVDYVFPELSPDNR